MFHPKDTDELFPWETSHCNIDYESCCFKRSARPALAAAMILSGIEMVHMMRKRQARYTYNPAPSLAEQFDILAA